jgi:hypothetical protein
MNFFILWDKLVDKINSIMDYIRNRKPLYYVSHYASTHSVPPP